MNIFYLDTNPRKSARMQCDKHCVKMILESAQMLSTAHRVLDGDEYADKMGLYKLAHKNHPSTVWVRSSSDNYRWLWKHYDALMQEYTLRYGKTHATSRLRNALLKLPTNIPNDRYADPPQCMPDEYKSDCTVTAYRNYYKGDKAGFARWKYTQPPQWW